MAPIDNNSIATVKHSFPFIVFTKVFPFAKLHKKTEFVVKL